MVAPVMVVALILLVWGFIGRSGGLIAAGAVVLVIGCGVLLFFRDPARQAPAGEEKVVSPADGRVILAEALPDGRRHVAVFMSVFDVHVNRAPVTGTIEQVTRTPGTYVHAGTERAGGNARVDVTAQSRFGEVRWRQVSGLIARKISCMLKPGDRIARGERFGLIYFGSRMDVYLPATARLVTEPGQRVRAGESVIAQFPIEGNE